MSEMAVLELSEAVSRDPDVMSGEIVFKDTRVPVWMLFDHLRHGHRLSEFFRSYPGVSADQADAVLSWSLEEIRRLFEEKKSA